MNLEKIREYLGARKAPSRQWKGVMKLWGWRGPQHDEATAEYQVACGCGSRAHTIEVAVEFEQDVGQLQLRFNADLADDTWQRHWWQRLWWRISMAAKALALGRVEGTHDIYLQDQDHIEDFMEALLQGIDEVQKWIDERTEEENSGR